MAGTLKFLQVNLENSKLAQNLLWQFVAERGIHVVIASEYYNVTGVQGWYTDRTGLAAIGVCPECPIAPGEVESGEGYVAVKMADMVVYSCYFSPNRPFPEYEDFLNKLEESLSRRQGEKFIVAGDFNAWSEE